MFHVFSSFILCDKRQFQTKAWNQSQQAQARAPSEEVSHPTAKHNAEVCLSLVLMFSFEKSGR
jgi:hypothetical protein